MRTKYNEWQSRKVEGMSEEDLQQWQKEDPILKKPRKDEEMG